MSNDYYVRWWLKRKKRRYHITELHANEIFNQWLTPCHNVLVLQNNHFVCFSSPLTVSHLWYIVFGSDLACKMYILTNDVKATLSVVYIDVHIYVCVCRFIIYSSSTWSKYIIFNLIFGLNATNGEEQFYAHTV